MIFETQTEFVIIFIVAVFLFAIGFGTGYISGQMNTINDIGSGKIKIESRPNVTTNYIYKTSQ